MGDTDRITRDPDIPPLWRRVVVAGLCLSGASVLSMLLSPLLGGRYPYLAFIPAIMLTAVYGRWRIATVTALASGVVAEMFFSQDARPGLHADTIVPLCGFYVVAGTMIACAEALHRSRAHARRLVRRLEISRNEAIDLNTRLEERVRTRTAELEAAHKSLHRVIDGLPDPMAAVDMKLRLTAFNRAYAVEFEQRFGRKPEMGAGLDELLSHLPEEQAKLMSLWKRSLAGETTSIEEFGDPERGRRFYEIHSCFVRDSAGLPTELIYSVRDTTEQRAMQETLKRLNLALEAQVETRTVQLSEAMHAAGFGTFEINFEKEEILWSPELKRIMQLPADLPTHHVPGTIPTNIHPDDRARVLEKIHAATDPHGAGEFDDEHRIIRTDGSLLWLLVRSKTFFEGKGDERRAVRTLGIALDITERKKSESALREAESKLRAQATELEALVASRTAKLTDTVTELESFTYTVAHDLRAPLRAITSMTALLQSELGEQVGEDAKDYMQRVRRAAARMDALIRDLLILSKVGRTQVIPGAVDLDGLVGGLIAENPDFQSPRAEVKIESPLGVVMGNEMLLTQALANLLGNAVKFIAPDAIPRVVVRSDRIGQRIRLWVEDNGIGIDAVYLKKIFGIFERLNIKFEGTGVGLAIVRRAVERLGGSVGVESAPGQGSRFWIELPAAREKPALLLKEANAVASRPD